jgi:hypothetical protein
VEFVYILTVVAAGLFVGAKVFEKVGNDAARITGWKDLQRGVIVFLIALAFGGLGALSERVDSLLLRWFAFVGVLASLTYSALHHYVRLRGKSL